ncbi:MAG: D-alanyl-D-alanine carboxypeptidase [Clostridiaceae bacterium]|jgi:D-alanyl-D-alanine carboxypeptidase (penicillin-binding protein 5/6)|nr:D-alanyl-D-alanine carboxypeptidase [Clostridiaceae bacterium]
MKTASNRMKAICYAVSLLKEYKNVEAQNRNNNMNTCTSSHFINNDLNASYLAFRNSEAFSAYHPVAKSTHKKGACKGLSFLLVRIPLYILLLIFFLWMIAAPVTTVALESLQTGKINGASFSLEDIALHSTAACMRVYLNGEVVDLVDLRKNDPVYTASLVKMMTLYTSYRLMEMKGIDPSQTVTVATSDLEGLNEKDASVMGLSVGETLPYKDVFYGLMLPSGADAGRLLSRTLAENSAAFIDAMNQDAADLGLKASHFTNTSGLFEPNNLSTMSDMATLLQALCEKPFLKEIISTRTYRTEPTNLRPGGHTLTHTIVTTGVLEGISTEKIEGGKTGSLQESGYCLASYRTFGNALVIITTTGAYRRGDNLRDHNALYDALEKQWPADGSPVTLVGAPEAKPLETNTPSSNTEYPKTTTSLAADPQEKLPSQSSSEGRDYAQTIVVIMASLLLVLSLGLLTSLILRNKKEEDERERTRRRY